MIINVRGTSGSGKSTLVREIMGLYPDKTRFKQEGRKQPIGYILSGPSGSLAVPGHYETACGGCDTINGLDTIYGLVRESADLGNHVLFEGLIVCSDFKRLVQLKEDGYKVLVVGLDTPLELCIDSVKARRLARGNEKELNPTNTAAKHKTNLRVLERFVEAGVDVAHLSRDAALERVKQEFGL